ncbi:hypothetical protein KCU67_g93, partial [Aureobasidium melanogenum]
MTHICSDKAPSPLPLSASLRSSLTPLSISLVDQSSYHSRKVFLSHATNANLPLRNMSSGCCPSESSDDERCSGEICDGTHANRNVSVPRPPSSVALLATMKPYKVSLRASRLCLCFLAPTSSYRGL